MSISKYDQHKSITEIKQDSEWNPIPTLVLRSAVNRVNDSFCGFFKRVKLGKKPGYPRFKGKDRYKSFSIPIWDGFKITDKSIGHSALVPIPKLGLIKFNQYRPHKGKITEIKLKKESSGWYVSLSCDLGDAPKKTEPKTVIGIDLRLKTFIVQSDNIEIQSPRFLKTSENLIAIRQKSFSRKKKGSNSRKRSGLLIAKAYEKVRNQRLDFSRKLAKNLYDQYDVICHENLNIKGIVQGLNLAKSVNDVAWGVFLKCLAFKAEEAGKWNIGVNPVGTTQNCSKCGMKVPKTLSERIHNCSGCGLVLGRDHNSAINIKMRGLRMVTELLSKINNSSEVSKVA